MQRITDDIHIYSQAKICKVYFWQENMHWVNNNSATPRKLRCILKTTQVWASSGIYLFQQRWCFWTENKSWTDRYVDPVACCQGCQMAKNGLQCPLTWEMYLWTDTIRDPGVFPVMQSRTLPVRRESSLQFLKQSWGWGGSGWGWAGETVHDSWFQKYEVSLSSLPLVQLRVMGKNWATYFLFI